MYSFNNKTDLLLFLPDSGISGVFLNKETRTVNFKLLNPIQEFCCLVYIKNNFSKGARKAAQDLKKN
jgi:hypothetical protein